MAKQETKIFLANMLDINHVAVDEQINRYLSDHSDHKISSVGFLNTGMFEKALVVFDIWEPREPKEKSLSKVEMSQLCEANSKNYKGGKVTTAQNNKAKE